MTQPQAHETGADEARRTEVAVNEPMFINVSFHEMVYFERHRRRMTQTALAKAAGCSRNYISLIERWEVVPSLEMIEKIADALGMRMTVKFEPKQAATE